MGGFATLRKYGRKRPRGRWARAKKLSAKKRTHIAKKAAKARWSRKTHP